MSTIGSRLKELRESKSKHQGYRLSKAFVARTVLKESKEYNLANYETDKAVPSDDKIQLLADFYEVPADYIKFGTTKNIDLHSLEDIFDNCNLSFEGRILTRYEKSFLTLILQMLRLKE